MELDPKYVDVIIRRGQEWAGQPAVRAADGMAFDRLAGIAKPLREDATISAPKPFQGLPT
jgi:hypothetical protein